MRFTEMGRELVDKIYHVLYLQFHLYLSEFLVDH